MGKLQITLLVAAAVLIILGIASGEALSVYEQGSIVCLECIGIG